MPKNGQARVPTTGEWRRLFEEIKKRRYPEKNTAIMCISRLLGLRVQEIALLQLKEVCVLDSTRTAPRGFRLLKVMTLPKEYTKGANATSRSRSEYVRRSLTFDVESFHQVVRQIEALAKAGASIDPTSFYPPVKERKGGRSRDLPLVDTELREALWDYLVVRLEKDPHANRTDPLFITQKGGPYSPNTLQDHMGKMLKEWAMIEKASSHSGRRALLTDIIHEQGQSVKVAQKIAGHKSAATTMIYEEPPEVLITDVLSNVKK